MILLILEKRYNFLSDRMYFTGNDGYQKLLVFASTLNLLRWDSNKKVTNWISTGVLPEKIKPFDTIIEPSMSNLANGNAKI